MVSSTRQTQLKWVVLESYLDGLAVLNPEEDVVEFTHHDFSYTTGYSGKEASGFIQAYRLAQMAKYSRTKFVISRVPGTRGRTTRWEAHFSGKGKAFERIVEAYREDAHNRSLNVQKDMAKLSRIDHENALPIAKAMVTLDGAVDVLVDKLTPPFRATG